MFLRKDNTLKWKWIGIGAIITAVFVMFGLFGMDKILHQIIHRPECNPWVVGNGFLCTVAVMLGKIFSTKVWLFGSLFWVIAFFFYKAFTNENDFRYAFIKIKNSYAFYVFASVVSALIVTGILRYFIGRSRPMLYDALGITTFRPFIWDSIFNSMPSGHSAAAFAGFVMIGMLSPRVKWLTWTLAILVAVSRVYVGAHWASDVIFGAFIGMVVADIVKWALKKINSK